MLTTVILIFGIIFTIELGTIATFLFLNLKNKVQLTTHYHTQRNVREADVVSDSIIEMEKVRPHINTSGVESSTVKSDESTVENSNNIEKLREILI